MDPINAEIVERRAPDVPPMPEMWAVIYWRANSKRWGNVTFHERHVADLHAEEFKPSYIYRLAPPKPAQPAPETAAQVLERLRKRVDIINHDYNNGSQMKAFVLYLINEELKNANPAPAGERTE